MKIIDLDAWKGKEHYLWFKEYAHPYYSITSKIKITKFNYYLKERNLPFYITLMYLLVVALNSIEEFRLRMDGDKVVLFEKIHPAFTVMTDLGIYANCQVELSEFSNFIEITKLAIEETKIGKRVGPGSYLKETRLDQYYLTCLPWLDFTSVSHPMTDNPKDSIPRIAWGKYYHEGKDIFLSLSIQVNHALIDGYPLAQAFLKIQEFLDEPEKILKEEVI